MAKKLVWTPNAREDLRSIIVYLKENWGSKSVDNFIQKLFSIIDLIEKAPLIGKTSKSDHTIWKLLVTKHNSIYYKVFPNKIILLDIFDTRQNPSKEPY